jgi:chromosome segregation ATPase
MAEESKMIRRELDESQSAAAARCSVLESERDSAREALASERKSRAKLENLMSGRLTDVHESRDLFTSRVSGLEVTLQEVTTQLERTTRERDEAISREIKARKEMGSLKSQAKMDAEEICLLRNALEKLTEESALLKTKTDHAGRERGEMEKRIQALSTKLQDLSGLCNDADALDTQLKERNNELLAVRQGKAEAEARVAALQTSMRQAEETFYRRIADVENAYKARLENATTDFETRYAELEAQIDSVSLKRQQSKEKAKSMVNVLDAQITSLQEEYALCVAAHREERSRLISAFEKRTKDLKATTEAALSEARSSGFKQSKQLMAMRSALLKDGQAVDALAAQLASASSQVAQMKKRERDFKLELAKSIALGHDLEARCARTEAQLSDTETRYRAACQEAATSTRKCASAVEESDALSKRLAVSQAAVHDLEEQGAKLQADLVQSSAQANSEKTGAENAKRLLLRAQATIKRLQTECATVERQRSSLQSAMDTKRKDFENLHARLNDLVLGNLNGSFHMSPSVTPLKALKEASAVENATDDDVTFAALTSALAAEEEGHEPDEDETSGHVSHCDDGLSGAASLRASIEDDMFWEVSAESDVITSNL